MLKSAPLPNWSNEEAIYTEDRLLIGGHQVMMAWELPMMYKMVEMLRAHTSGDVLEIGFGMGISANKIQEMGFKSHTILEPHPQVYEKALAWKAERPDSDITIIQDYWQNLEDSLKQQYDGIFFDPYAPTREIAEREKFHFFRVAFEKWLKPNGATTLYNLNPHFEITYQDEIFTRFSKTILEKLSVDPTPDCDYTVIDMVPSEDKSQPSNYQYTLCILLIK
ncbi:MAG: class I SAM-dependent methyltransferase [Cyanobacteria bacterium SBLK]|nr:class I SAM-dependent methyltransferase [Cyanobacteria bacterium SBLK]